MEENLKIVWHKRKKCGTIKQRKEIFLSRQNHGSGLSAALTATRTGS